MRMITPQKVRRWCPECQQVTESVIDPRGTERCGRHEPNSNWQQEDPQWATLDDCDEHCDGCDCGCHE